MLSAAKHQVGCVDSWGKKGWAMANGSEYSPDPDKQRLQLVLLLLILVVILAIFIWPALIVYVFTGG
jgi:hypothetical protein